MFRVLSAVSFWQWCNQWAVYLYMHWGYAPVVPPHINFLGYPPEVFFWGGGHPEILCSVYVVFCCPCCCTILRLLVCCSISVLLGPRPNPTDYRCWKECLGRLMSTLTTGSQQVALWSQQGAQVDSQQPLTMLTTCCESWSHSYSHNLCWQLTACWGRPEHPSQQAHNMLWSTWAPFTTGSQHVVKVASCCGPVVSRPKHPVVNMLWGVVVVHLSTLLWWLWGLTTCCEGCCDTLVVHLLWV